MGCADICGTSTNVDRDETLDSTTCDDPTNISFDALF